MKKILPVGLVLILVFSACGGVAGKVRGGKNPLEGRSGHYATQASFRCKGMQATASITQETPSSCAVVFDSPQPIAGMEFIFAQDDVQLRYKGMSFTFAKDSVPHGAAANLAVLALNKVMSGEELEVQSSDGVREISGMLESGEFILELDDDSGGILKLSVPAEELEIEFNNFRFLD